MYFRIYKKSMQHRCKFHLHVSDGIFGGLSHAQSCRRRRAKDGACAVGIDVLFLHVTYIYTCIYRYRNNTSIPTAHAPSLRRRSTSLFYICVFVLLEYIVLLYFYFFMYIWCPLTSNTRYARAANVGGHQMSCRIVVCDKADDIHKTHRRHAALIAPIQRIDRFF